jgi:hypothetical protein
VGSSISLIEKIVSNEINNGIAFVEPNSIGKNGSFEELVVKMAIQKLELKRILILSWDENHNLGTQTAFYESQKYELL